MEKIKNFVSSLHLRLSDLLIFIGFIFFALFLIFGQLFMQYPNPNDVAFKLWMIIPSFVIVAVCWSAYTYLEFKLGNGPKNYISMIFIALAIIGVIGILIQPSTFQEVVIIRNINEYNLSLYGEGLQIGDMVNAPIGVMNISLTHYLFFAMDIVLVLFFIYIGLFIFPKRFSNISFIKYLGYAVIVFCLVLILYSYIFEHANYIGFFKAIFQHEGDINNYAVHSFIIHKNAYGMTLMIGIIFAFINHSIEKKWWYYLFALFFLINMLFSLCKTGILISLLLIAIYLVYRLVVTFKENKKRNLIISIVGGSILLIGIVVIGVSYLSKGQFLGFIYNLLKGGDTNTLDTRSFIWDNCFQLLREHPIYYLFGRGFGLINMMLLPMNAANGDPVFPTHSAYVNLLCEGGILYLFAYLAFLIYCVYIIIKTFKKSPELTIAIALGVLAFFLYSFIETIHYLVYAFMLPVMILYQVSYKDGLNNNND